MNLLIVADPIRGLKPETDTGLSLAREAFERGHSVFWATAEDFCLWSGQVRVRATKLVSCPVGALPESERFSEDQLISEFDAVLIRKDPPFDQSYQTLCWLLALEQEKTLILNPPETLLRFHEKMLPFEGLRRGYLDSADLIPTYLPIGDHLRMPADFPDCKETVMKPWFGFGGCAVAKRVRPVKNPRGFTMLQPYLPSVIRSGDRRVFFLEGEYVADFVRVPAKGKFVANLCRGGTAVLTERSPREIELCWKVGRLLKNAGIFLAGADFLDEKVSEINITAPTGFETLSRLGGPRLNTQVIERVEGKLASANQESRARMIAGRPATRHSEIFRGSAVSSSSAT